MHTCSNCGREYEVEENCPYCNIGRKVIQDGVEWSVLTKVSNDIEFEMIAGLLSMGNIPVVKKIGQIDGFVKILIGVPIAGIEVLVPSDRFQEARDLIEASVDDKESFSEDE